MSSRLGGGGGGGGSTTDASLLTTGTLPLARLSGITTTQLDAAAGITSAQIAALDAAKITTGTLPLARLSGITTSQLSASAALAAGQIASVNPSTLTGSGTVPLAALTGITTTQLDAAAAITSAQIAALDAAKITSGTLPLARLSGITTSQLDAAAAITSGQIASLAASKITGTNTLPDGVLSTNVPLLNAGNTFSALQTIAASIAGPLAQINNSSTTGAGLVIGSTTVASAGAGKIAPALALTQTTPTTANYGLLSAGGGPWDGSTSGKYVGSSSGTLYAGNAASGFVGNLLDLQLAGVAKVQIAASGNATFTNVVQVPNQGISFAGAGATLTRSGTDGSITLQGQSFTGAHFYSVSGHAAAIPLVLKSAASATSDLFQAQDSASHTQFGIMNGGSGGSPVWALRVRATANAESMAVAHTAGAATGKCIQVFDDAGTSLGYLALYS